MWGLSEQTKYGEQQKLGNSAPTELAGLISRVSRRQANLAYVFGPKLTRNVKLMARIGTFPRLVNAGASSCAAGRRRSKGHSFSLKEAMGMGAVV